MLKKEILSCYFFWEGRGASFDNDDIDNGCYHIVENDHEIDDGNTMEDMMTNAKYAGSNGQPGVKKNTD